MTNADVDRLSRLMLDEFKRVHERFDTIDQRFDNIEARLTSIEAELRDIRGRLEALEEAADSAAGYAKEIDHLLRRVTAIEKHLGLQAHIRA